MLSLPASIDLSLLELVKFAFMTFTTAHWLACLWGFVGRLGPNLGHDNAPQDPHTWYVRDFHRLTWVQTTQMTDATPFELYSACLYVALSNIFGGPTEIYPQNYIEYWAQAFMMFVGSSLWAYIIGCGVNSERRSRIKPAASRSVPAVSADQWSRRLCHPAIADQHLRPSPLCSCRHP